MLNKIIISFFAVGLLTTGVVFGVYQNKKEITGAPPDGVSESDVPEMDLFSYFRNWKRPDGPAKVGIQVGHWKNDEVPDELERLRGNTGASGGGMSEWEVNFNIATEMQKILQESGITVEILPATVPPSYVADIFIAIHADGNEDLSKSGYKFAGPWRDFTGKGGKLIELLSNKYEEQTHLEFDPNITQNMRGYYAFSWWKNIHAVHPMTVSVIAETGFLTNKNDQKLLINTPEIPAQAMSDAIIKYLKSEELI